MKKMTLIGKPIKQGLTWAQEYKDSEGNVATVYARKKGDIKRHVEAVNSK